MVFILDDNDGGSRLSKQYDIFPGTHEIGRTH